MAQRSCMLLLTRWLLKKPRGRQQCRFTLLSFLRSLPLRCISAARPAGVPGGESRAPGPFSCANKASSCNAVL